MQTVEVSNVVDANNQRTEAHELWFQSLFNPGRGVSFPCDDKGLVNLDAMPERMRNCYLAARAMLGYEYATPGTRVASWGSPTTREPKSFPRLH